MEQYTLLDSNSGFVNSVPVVVSLRWRAKQTTSGHLGGITGYTGPDGINSALVPYSTGGMGRTVTLGAWNLGGLAPISRYYCKYQNPSSFASKAYFKRPAAIAGKSVASYGSVWNYFRDTNVEIDWETSLAGLRATYDPAFYAIGIVRICDAAGVEQATNMNTDSLTNLTNINAGYRSDNPEASELFTLDYDNYMKDVVVGGSAPTDPPQTTVQTMEDFRYNGITDDADGENFNNDCHSVGLNSCSGNGTTIPMYLLVYVKALVNFNAGDPDEMVDSPDLEEDPVNDMNQNVGSSGSTGNGSDDEGMNTFSSNYGNSNLPFNSVHLTGSNYNSFIAAGGGIISNSGIFPISSTLYIENVKLGVEGSSATIKELVAFDSTPSLNIGDKLYIYLFNATNSSKPVFYGYITSQKRVLTGDTTEIEYDCNDLTYFLDQFYTPSHYIYRPPSYEGSGVTKSYDRVLKEILNIAGIPNAILDVPDFNSPPMTWIYQSLKSVLEWATNFFGNYVYFIDRYGRLRFKGVDSGSVVKTYAVGSLTEDNCVESFNPITDYSRSRSRIVLTGDFEITEKKITSRFTRGGELNPSDNDNQTGIFWFYDNVDDDLYDDDDGEKHKFYYFMFKPKETLNDKLLTDKNKSCRVVIKNYKNEDGTTEDKEISPRVFKTEAGDSEIYCEGDEFSQSRNIEVIYAVRSDSPIQVAADTLYDGGTEVVRRPEFKKATSLFTVQNDVSLMNACLAELKTFYKPTVGGTLVVDGIDLDIELLDKVTVTGTALNSTETDSLAIYGITYDCVSLRTTIELSNKSLSTLPFFDVMRERSRESNEKLAKMGILEETSLYRR